MLLDWDRVGQGPRLASLGWALFDAAVRERGAGGVEAVFTGWASYQRLTATEIERLPDAIRYRPLTHAVRSFAARIKGTSDEPRQWGDRYEEAESVAARVRVMSRA